MGFVNWGEEKYNLSNSFVFFSMISRRDVKNHVCIGLYYYF